MQRVAVVGGGISGLVAAYRLSQVPSIASVELFEASSSVGGWIQSERLEGALLESGPRSLRPSAATLQLLDEIDLGSKILPAHRNAKKRFILLNGQLQPVPGSLAILRKVLPAVGRDLFMPCSRAARASLRDGSNAADGDESVYDLVERRFGAEVAENLLDPFVSGIYAGDPHQLSARMVSTRLKAMDDAGARSLLLAFLRANLVSSSNASSPPSTTGGRPVLSPSAARVKSIFTLRDDGLALLPRTLASILRQSKKVSMHLNTPFPPLAASDGAVLDDKPRSSRPAVSDFDRVYWCAPLSVPWLPHASVTVVNVVIHRRDADDATRLLASTPIVHGFGHLVPANQGEDVLGVVYDSSVFPANNSNSRSDDGLSDRTVNLTVMMGGARRPEITHSWSDKRVVDRAMDHLQRVLPFVRRLSASSPTGALIQQRVVRNIGAIPQYPVGHTSLLRRYQQMLDREYGAGTATADGKGRVVLLGPAASAGPGVNDCIAAVQQAISLAAGASSGLS